MARGGLRNYSRDRKKRRPKRRKDERKGDTKLLGCCDLDRLNDLIFAGFQVVAESCGPITPHETTIFSIDSLR